MKTTSGMDTFITAQALEAGTGILGRAQVCLCRGGVRKARTQLKLNSGRDAKNNKGFCKCVSQKQ